MKGQRGMAPRNIDAAEQLQKSPRRNSLDYQLSARRRTTSWSRLASSRGSRAWRRATSRLPSSCRSRFAVTRWRSSWPRVRSTRSWWQRASPRGSGRGAARGRCPGEAADVGQKGLPNQQLGARPSYEELVERASPRATSPWRRATSTLLEQLQKSLAATRSITSRALALRMTSRSRPASSRGSRAWRRATSRLPSSWQKSLAVTRWRSSWPRVRSMRSCAAGIAGAAGAAPRVVDAQEKPLRRGDSQPVLGARPSYEQLVEAGIAKGQPGMAPATSTLPSSCRSLRRNSRGSAAGLTSELRRACRGWHRQG